MIRFTVHVRHCGERAVVSLGRDADSIEISLRVWSWILDSIRHNHNSEPGDYRVTYTTSWMMVERVAA